MMGSPFLHSTQGIKDLGGLGKNRVSGLGKCSMSSDHGPSRVSWRSSCRASGFHEGSRRVQPLEMNESEYGVKRVSVGKRG